MGAYILRRLLLIIPTLLGIMVINFTLTQFVPGGPVEQAIARAQGQGDVFGSFAGNQGDAGLEETGPLDDRYVGARGLPEECDEHCELDCSHMGFGVSKKAVRLVVREIDNFLR